jgi:hypothetical protein
VDIEQVLDVQQITHVGVESMIFLCRATVWGRPWQFRLKYMFRSHMWWMLGRTY